ncbi:hypothetical protein [Blastococcus brunescens]|uniref:DUF4386 family protein n=1 Tax=Blastococcus brunescens TaxID=1564165 RepID=A0ABZ1B4U2_9ACTN|nr:hypothetical protein [Blastococcus sp. BMG 8361]WRL65825.1 hypothetical protein U6N30_09805 [Blastococcus sp. BMG 8361]
MTALDSATGATPRTATAPPFSRALRIAAGVSLILAGMLNGLSQFAGELLTGDLSFSQQIAWGADHPVAHGVEQTALVVSSLFMPLGLLGVAHVCRFRAPVLTAIATPLVIWGMWGFGNVLAMGYTAGTIAPSVLSVDQAMRLNDGLSEHGGSIATGLVPHLIGSFFGVLLLSVAAWRSGAFPRMAVALLVAFVVWDFALPPLGPIDAHILLVIAWTWLGVHLVRMSGDVWRGARAG